MPRPRGIRAGKSAVRKRKAYQAYQLALQPYRYSSAEEVPVFQDGSSRPLYTRPGWKPDFESDEDEEELEEVIVEVEVYPLIPKSSGSAPSFHRLPRQPPPPPAPPVRPSSAPSASSSVPKPSSTPKAAKVSSGAVPSTPAVAKASAGAASSTPTVAKASSVAFNDWLRHRRFEPLQRRKHLLLSPRRRHLLWSPRPRHLSQLRRHHLRLRLRPVLVVRA